MAQKNIIKRVISSPLVQTFLIYVSGGWIALEITDYIINNYGLNERVRDVLSIILLVGLPIAIFLAWYLSREKVESKEEVVEISTEKKRQRIVRVLRKKPWFSIPGVVVIVLLIISGARYIHRQVKISWVMEELLPEIELLKDELNTIEALKLAEIAEKYIPDDSALSKLTEQFTCRLTILSDPPGAEVYIKEYNDAGEDWQLLGKTPIESIRMPIAFFNWKFEKPGYDHVLAAMPSPLSGLFGLDTIYRTLHKKGEVPPGMVYVEGVGGETGGDFLSGKHGFFIDKYEVTNKQFKKFMDDGGYKNTDYWQAVVESKETSWEQIMEHFKDATGRPGPATWVAGDFAEGQDDYPVSGISWYEASAYAEYAGKNLPSSDHWQSAAGLEISSYLWHFAPALIPLSNLRGKSSEPVGENPGLNCFGTYDMAGNVREWCMNETGIGRIIRGGSWNDLSYLFTEISQLPVMDRSIENGFRCVSYLDQDHIPEEAFLPVIMSNSRDYNHEEPVSDAEFQIYKKQFLYDKTELNIEIEERKETAKEWIEEKVTYDAAYENERITAYLYLPKGFSPPFQTVIYFPHSGAEESLDYKSTNDPMFSAIDFIIKNGRAVLFPIYKGTYERNVERPLAARSYAYNDMLIKQVKDFSRSIDYLSTRPDIDTSKLGYYGTSMGGRLGIIMLAIEKRIKSGLLVFGGLGGYNRYSEVDEINYVSRVETPVLMMNGRYDFIFPLETNVKPMFELLGTPEEDKSLKLYDTPHYMPRNELIKETLNWLDKYFGPVNN
jgi:dienelactone hydrolase